MLELRFHPSVAQDLDEAIGWYEERSRGWGATFRIAVDERLDDILNSANFFPRAFNDLDYRFARLTRFPFLILFEVSEGTVHSASDPMKWRRRQTPRR